MDYLLVDMLETDNGTALGIYSKLKETFDDLHILVTHIIGYSSDTTNVMFGQLNSVAQIRLQLHSSCEVFLPPNSSGLLLCCTKTSKKCRKSLSGFVCSFLSLIKKEGCL